MRERGSVRSDTAAILLILLSSCFGSDDCTHVANVRGPLRTSPGFGGPAPTERSPTDIVPTWLGPSLVPRLGRGDRFLLTDAFPVPWLARL